MFSWREGYDDRPLSVPCGQCTGCRLERSRQWAVRCVHEAKMHSENTFITLTYSPEKMPYAGTLVLDDWQKFMKRLGYYAGGAPRFYMCGEYGDIYGRPHYHACLFGYDFQDKKFYATSRNGDRLYTSALLEKIWGNGLCMIGDVTFQSAAYVARYIMKKRLGKEAHLAYERFVPETGEIYNIKPEFTTMSRGRGIGFAWYEKYKRDVFPLDRVVMNGVKFRPPRFYDGMYELDNPEGFQKLKSQRVSKSKRHSENNTDRRLKDREEVQQARIKRLQRGVE